MADTVRFRCKSCGNRFEAEVLDEDEEREAERQRRPTYTIQCPQCRRTDIRRGWD